MKFAPKTQFCKGFGLKTMKTRIRNFEQPVPSPFQP